MNRILIVFAALYATAALPASPLQGADVATINQCLPSIPPVNGVSELIGCSLRFNALGEIQFSFKNRGTVGINTTAVGSFTAPQSKSTQAAATPIKIDVYLQGTRIQSVYQQILAAGQLKEMTVKIPSNYPTPRCGEVRALRIVIDPQNQIREAADGDNTVDRPAADRPCPDVAIESIKKNSNAAKTEFVAEVKLVNLGNAHARFRYLATTGSNGIIAPLPDLDYDIVMELEPGQSKKFTVGSALGINNMHVMVMLDRMQEVPELNEGNNYAEKVLD